MLVFSPGRVKNNSSSKLNQERQINEKRPSVQCKNMGNWKPAVCLCVQIVHTSLCVLQAEALCEIVQCIWIGERSALYACLSEVQAKLSFYFPHLENDSGSCLTHFSMF